MAGTSDIRNGLVIRYNGELYKVIDFQHFKMGRGGAKVRTKMKSIPEGNVIEEEIVEDIVIERVDPGHREALTSLGTTPRSHKCVRNFTSHAKFIYEWAEIGKTIVIVIE